MSNSYNDAAAERSNERVLATARRQAAERAAAAYAALTANKRA